METGKGEVYKGSRVRGMTEGYILKCCESEGHFEIINFVLILSTSKLTARKMNISPAHAIRDTLRGYDHNRCKLCLNILSMLKKKKKIQGKAHQTESEEDLKPSARCASVKPE